MSADPDPVAEGSKSEQEYALEQAKSTGQPYELTSARTEASDTWAYPDGTWSVKRYGAPVRMLREGAWIATDPNLAFQTDGSVKPRATSTAVTFSGGGTGPMLSGVKDGRALTLTWPKALPKPTLNENVATYPEVLAGVDLQLKAEVDGFSQLLVVKTAEAAQNPEVASLRYKLDTIGLKVATNAQTGSITASNAAGQTIFSSPTPLMWDSSTTNVGPAPLASKSAVARFTEQPGTQEVPAGAAFEPAPGAKDAQMPTTVSGDTLEIKPDQQLLTAPDTKYPVFIDPYWNTYDSGRQSWTRVYKRYPNTSFWNSKEVARVGYENETNGLSRSFFQMDTAGLKNTDVHSSVFRIKNVWSWSCRATKVDLWSTGTISSRTNWSNQPARYAQLAEANDAKGWSKDCAAGNLEFDATAKVREAASKGWSNITLGLYAHNEGPEGYNPDGLGREDATFGWKKFDSKTAVLETKYNHKPEAPSNLGTNPTTDCSAGGLIGNAQISVHATFNDKDAGNLTGEFQIFKPGLSDPVAKATVPAAKGRVAPWVVPDGNLPTGDYTWRARSQDEAGAYSSWSRTCKFSVDRTRPSKPPVISSVDNLFPPGDAGWPKDTGRARDEGKFTFTPNGVTDVAKYTWWTDYAPQRQNAAPGVQVVVKPPGYGPHFVYAFSSDKAGNQSDTATYVYYAKSNPQRDAPTDLNGDGLSDIWSIDSNGTLLTYAGQGNGQFSAAANGGASFEGGLVDSRGGWRQSNYNDLVSLESDPTEKTKRLWVYENDGSGAIYNPADQGDSHSRIELNVTCPVKGDSPCDYGDATWTGDDHWHDADQIITPGDINGDGQPDLLVKEGRQLWAYFGSRAALTLDTVRPPVLIGDSNWDRYTVIAPGDVNRDGVPDLWLRDNKSANGDIYVSRGAKDPNSGNLDPVSWGTNIDAKPIGTGFKASDFPVIGSVGDIAGLTADSSSPGRTAPDGIPDLWARKTDNTMLGWQGKIPGSDGNSFGSSFLIDGITGGTRIPADTTLSPGKSFASRSAKLTMQTDGNLVISSNGGTTLWSTKTSGNPGAKAQMGPDGNLRVYAPDGITKLWGTDLDPSKSPGLTAGGYALLQDRGNLIMYNIKGQSLWSSGTAIRHDYNGDGRSDLGAWYSYADGHSAFQTFLTNSDGTFNAPFGSYTSGVGSWNVNRMKFVTGDFNGDGRGDAVMSYDYGGGLMKIYTCFGKADGGFQFPVLSYTSGAGGWYSESMSLEAGDFNGDGRDDLAVWYQYAAGGNRLFTFTTNPQGMFNYPLGTDGAAPSSWDMKRSKFVTGDFNGDGRDDLAAYYNYPGDGSSKLFTFVAAPTGGFAPGTSIWGDPSWSDLNRLELHAGDFNGDGLDDVTLWYDYADGHDGLSTWFLSGNRDGKLDNARQVWSSAAGNWERNQMKIFTGDFDGDGRDDIGCMFHYLSTDTTKMFTWTTKPDGTLNPVLGGWTGTPSNWSYAATTALRPYN
ncbi:FG-GAP-like repeat-containing protein [Streptomyces hundungensis]|uniref:FG-GAP-like repeat-containing protein n=1 Tax=Streptomyces hundungensis TaxID=1077946 RepID=UPI0033CABEF5